MPVPGMDQLQAIVAMLSQLIDWLRPFVHLNLLVKVVLDDSSSASMLPGDSSVYWRTHRNGGGSGKGGGSVSVVGMTSTSRR